MWCLHLLGSKNLYSLCQSNYLNDLWLPLEKVPFPSDLTTCDESKN